MTQDFHAGALFWWRGITGSKPGYRCAYRVNLQKTNAKNRRAFLQTHRHHTFLNYCTHNVCTLHASTNCGLYVLPLSKSLMNGCARNVLGLLVSHL